MYYTACLLLTIQWQLLCQAMVDLVCKWVGCSESFGGGGGEGGATPGTPPLDSSLHCTGSYIPKNHADYAEHFQEEENQYLPENVQTQK